MRQVYNVSDSLINDPRADKSISKTRRAGLNSGTFDFGGPRLYMTRENRRRGVPATIYFAQKHMLRPFARNDPPCCVCVSFRPIPGGSVWKRRNSGAERLSIRTAAMSVRFARNSNYHQRRLSPLITNSINYNDCNFYKTSVRRLVRKRLDLTAIILWPHTKAL